MKTVGIIGGLGPETTSKFYLEVSYSCQKINKESRPPILICSIPLPYALEEEAIVLAKGEERCLPYIVEAAKTLENAGADFLVMPCNSLHIFIENIRREVKIPVLSIVEETVNFLKKKNISKTGIISTAITINKKLYENFFILNGIIQIKPSDEQQGTVGKTIHDLVMNRYDENSRKEIMKIIGDFEKEGVKHVVLACTDLQSLNLSHDRLEIYDTMKILADATVKKIIET